MKTYTFELVIKEGNDEFWEQLEGIPGCTQVTKVIEQALLQYGFDVGNDCDLTLKEYKNVE